MGLKKVTTDLVQWVSSTAIQLKAQSPKKKHHPDTSGAKNTAKNTGKPSEKTADGDGKLAGCCIGCHTQGRFETLHIVFEKNGKMIEMFSMYGDNYDQDKLEKALCVSPRC